MMVFSNFLNFFAIFFGIFYYESGRNTSERFFFSLFLNLYWPVLAWKETMMVFSNFLNFFAIFLEFSIMGRVGKHWNNFFYFLSFSVIPNLFWLEMKLWWCFVISWIFLLFFLEFSIPGLVRTYWNDFFYFLSISAFLDLFLPEKKLW